MIFLALSILYELSVHFILCTQSHDHCPSLQLQSHNDGIGTALKPRAKQLTAQVNFQESKLAGLIHGTVARMCNLFAHFLIRQFYFSIPEASDHIQLPLQSS